MILCDTSVWIEHLRRGEPHLVTLLQGMRVLMHPFVLGEMACGALGDGDATLELLARLPAAPLVTPQEALTFIGARARYGRGIGYVEVHVLASTLLSGAELWTKDRRLHMVANALGVARAWPEGMHPVDSR